MYLLNRRLGGLQNRSEGTGEHKNHLLFSGLEIWIVQTAALPLYWLSYPGSFCYSVWHSNIVRTKITDTRLLHLYKKKYRGICFHAIKEVWDQFSISSSSSITNFGDLCLSCKCRYFTDPTLLCVRVISFFFFQKTFSIIFVPLLGVFMLRSFSASNGCTFSPVCESFVVVLRQVIPATSLTLNTKSLH